MLGRMHVAARSRPRFSGDSQSLSRSCELNCSALGWQRVPRMCATMSLHRHQPGHRLTRRVRAGLTLVELAIVVLTMGVLSSVAVTRVSSHLHRQAVDGAVRLLIADLVNARQEALTTSSTVSISVNRTENTYVITANRNGAPTIIRSVDLSSGPWHCSIASLLTGPARTAATTATITANGAGVFSSDLVLGVARGRHSASIRVEAVSSRVLKE